MRRILIFDYLHWGPAWGDGVPLRVPLAVLSAGVYILLDGTCCG